MGRSDGNGTPAKMTNRRARSAQDWTTSRWLPYVLTGIGLPVGLLVVLLGPLPSLTLNYLVGGALIAVAFGSVAHLIAQHSAPGERGPDF